MWINFGLVDGLVDFRIYDENPKRTKVDWNIAMMTPRKDFSFHYRVDIRQNEIETEDDALQLMKGKEWPGFFDVSKVGKNMISPAKYNA